MNKKPIAREGETPAEPEAPAPSLDPRKVQTRRSARRLHLTRELRSQIIAAVRAGGYAHVAAGAFGVPKSVFDDWMKRGGESDAREPYASFARDVHQSLAQARLRAEMSLFEAEPKLWLIHGPGRETDDSPGWSVSVKPADLSSLTRNVLLDPELMALFRTLMEVLRPYPEACSQVAQTLMNTGIKP